MSAVWLVRWFHQILVLNLWVYLVEICLIEAILLHEILQLCALGESEGKQVVTNMPDLCKNCYKGIQGVVVTYEGGTYHPDCFSCSMCNGSLSGTTFQWHEGKKVCQSCFREWLAKRCGKCNQLIVGNVQFVNYEDKTYHNECFVCYKCRKPLSGLKFRVHGENRICTSCDWILCDAVVVETNNNINKFCF